MSFGMLKFVGTIIRSILAATPELPVQLHEQFPPTPIILRDQPPIQENEDVFLICNLSKSGLRSPTVPPSVLFEELNYFVRPSSRTLWNSLNCKAIPYENKAVYSSPGTGKSCEVFAYAMHRATRGGLRVLYVHSSDHYHTIISKSGSDVTGNVDDVVRADQWVFPVHGKRKIDLFVFVDELMDKTRYEVVVVIACAQELCQFVYCTAPAGAAIICTSYLAIPITAKFEVAHPTDLILIPSWSEEELLNAASSGAIGPFTEEEHKQRYFLGGASICLYLMPADEVQDVIDYCFASATNIVASVKVHIGPTSPAAVNVILAQLSSESLPDVVLVSQYATKRLAKYASLELITHYRAALRRNATWQGWVTQMEVVHLLYKGSLSVWNVHEETETWAGGPSSCRFVADHTKVKRYEEYPPGMWVFPYQWTGGLFDGLQIVGDVQKTLRVVQITNAKTPSFQLAYLSAYLDSLGAYKVDFVFACHRKNFVSFLLPTARADTETGTETGGSLVDAEDIQCVDTPERTKPGGLLRRGQDFVVKAHARLRIEVRKVCYEAFQVPSIGKRSNPYTFFDPYPKVQKYHSQRSW